MRTGVRRVWRALVLGDGIGAQSAQTGAERQALALASSLLKLSPNSSQTSQSDGWNVRTASLAAVQHPMPRLFRPAPDGSMRQLAYRLSNLAFLSAPSAFSPLARTKILRGNDLPHPFSDSTGDFSDTLLISAGSGPSASAVAASRTLKGCKLIQVLHPRKSTSAFDVVVTPRHDFEEGEPLPANFVLTDGSLHDVTPQKLALHAKKQPCSDIAALAEPRVAVLLGGPRRSKSLAHGWSDDDATELANALHKCVAERGSVVITASRRTPMSFALNLQTILNHKLGRRRVLYDDGSIRGRYLYMLATCDAAAVTADSVNMMSEAVASGSNVLIFGSSGSNRLNRYRDSLIQQGKAQTLSADSATPEMLSRRVAENAVQSEGVPQVDRVAAAVWKIIGN